MSDNEIPIIRGIFNRSTMFDIFGMDQVQHDNIVTLDAPSLLRIMNLGAIWGHTAQPMGDVNPSEKVPAFLESIFDYPDDVERYVRHEYDEADYTYQEMPDIEDAPRIGYDAANVGGLMILSCIWTIMEDMGAVKPDEDRMSNLVEHIYEDPQAGSLYIKAEMDRFLAIAEQTLRL